MTEALKIKKLHHETILFSGVVSYQHLEGFHSYLMGNVSRDEENVRATKGN